jgi:hypothetical protein
MSDKDNHRDRKVTLPDGTDYRTEAPGFTPTVQDLEALAYHWYHDLADLAIFMAEGGGIGSTEMVREREALERVGAVGEALEAVWPGRMVEIRAGVEEWCVKEMEAARQDREERYRERERERQEEEAARAKEWALQGEA